MEVVHGNEIVTGDSPTVGKAKRTSWSASRFPTNGRRIRVTKR